MFQAGFEYTILKEDIAKLNAATEMFKLSTPEEDLIHKKLQPGTTSGEWMSLTEIQQYLMLETKFNYLNTHRIGTLLSLLGFVKDRKTMGGSKITMYYVYKNAINLDNPGQPYTF
jgi:hypothetical protein